MTKKERMLAALHHQPVDRIPRGELGIESGFIQDYLEVHRVEKNMSLLEKEVYIRNELGFDFINIHEFPRKLLGYANDGHPIYKSPYGDVFKELPHSFQLLKPGVEGYCMTDTELIAQLAEKIMDYEIGRAKRFLDGGAEAILIGDDMAFNTGPLLPPHIMEEVAYPFYKKAIQVVLEAVIKACGLDALLDKVVDFYLECNKRMFEKAGNLMQIFFMGDDYGTQRSLLYGPDLFRRFIKPRLKKLYDLAKSYGYIVQQYSCGSIVRIIPDLIDNGLDGLHPIQVSAAGLPEIPAERIVKMYEWAYQYGCKK